MRECPRCHYVDPMYWRHPAFYPDLDYVLYEDFPKTLELTNEQLPNAKVELELHPGKYAMDSITQSAYYLSKTQKWTYRVWLPIFRAFGGEGGTPHSQIRKNKFYDKAGRINQTAYTRLFAAMNQNRLPRNKLDQYITVMPDKP